MWKFEYFWLEMGQIKAKNACIAAPFKKQNTAHTHTMAKGPSNKNFCHSTSFSILWGGKKMKKNELFLGNEGNYDHERNFIHEYDLNL